MFEWLTGDLYRDCDGAGQWWGARVTDLDGQCVRVQRLSVQSGRNSHLTSEAYRKSWAWGQDK